MQNFENLKVFSKIAKVSTNQILSTGRKNIISNFGLLSPLIFHFVKHVVI